MCKWLFTSAVALSLALAPAGAQEKAKETPKVSAADVDTLIRVVQDKQESTIHRETACVELSGLGKEARKAVPALRQALKEGNTPLVLRALHTLQCIGPEAASAVPEIVPFVGSESAVSTQAVQTLGSIGPAASSAVPKLAEALYYQYENARYPHAILAAMLTIEKPDAATMKRVTSVLNAVVADVDANKALYGRAVYFAPPLLEYLRKCGPKSAEAVDGLYRLATIPNSSMWSPNGHDDASRDKLNYRLSALRALAAVGTPEARDKLERIRILTRIAALKAEADKALESFNKAETRKTVEFAGTWVGSETLAGFDKLTFELRADGKATMIDAQSTVKGAWTRDGDMIVITFANCVYTGQCDGKRLGGTAVFIDKGQPKGSSWTFEVTRQK